MDFNAILATIAKEHNTTTDQVKADMEEAIASAKDNENFKLMFGGRIPSVEEFISAMALMTQKSDGPRQ